MTQRELVLEAISHHDTPKIPYTLGFEVGIGDELDAYYGSTEWREHVTPYLRPVGGVDTTAEEMIDDVHARDAFGSIWRMDRRPWHLETPALSKPTLEGFDFPTADRFPLTIVDNVGELTGPGAQHFAYVSIGWGLFEQAWRIRGFENMMMDCILEPDFYAELLGKLTELRLAFVERFKDVPCDAIMFGDDWGDQRGVLIGPERWRKFIKPCWAKVYEAVHAQGKYVLSHCCGSIVDIMPDIVEIGLDVLESVQPEAAGMNPYELERRWGDKITFWGGLGSQSTIQFGTPQEIHAEVDRLCADMGQGGGYILAPAKSLQPGTPVENAAAVVEAFAKQNL